MIGVPAWLKIPLAAAGTACATAAALAAAIGSQVERHPLSKAEPAALAPLLKPFGIQLRHPFLPSAHVLAAGNAPACALCARW